MKGNTVKTPSPEKGVIFVIKPKDPMKPVRRDSVPEEFVDLKKKILEENGDMYFIEGENKNGKRKN